MHMDGVGSRNHHICAERAAARRFVAPKAARGFVYYAPESLTILQREMLTKNMTLLYSSREGKLEYMT